MSTTVALATPTNAAEIADSAAPFVIQDPKSEAPFINDTAAQAAIFSVS